MAKKTTRTYGCGGCGDLTTGSRSTSTGNEYACCPDCCDRVDAIGSDGVDTDRGPYVERGEFQPCPKCGGSTLPAEPEGYMDLTQLRCEACGHQWQPRGAYLSRREIRERELARG